MSTLEVVDVDPTKRLQLDRLLAEASGFGCRVAEANAAKPWGGYLRFTLDSLPAFLHAYWRNQQIELPLDKTSVDPKMLLVAPNQMLSLQWHRRRGEIWRVIDGPVRITVGDDWNGLKDKDCHKEYASGDVIIIPVNKWHRLIGLEGWGRVAEIWQHTNGDCPSDEDDVVREHDIYNRASLEAEAKWNNVYPY